MVSRDTTSAFGSARLIKAALRGKQDLALGDSAADGTRKIWELCGGTVSRLYSFHWLRPIRPFSFGLEHLLNPGHALLKSLLTPFCSLADVASDRIVRAVSRRVPDDSIAEEVSVEELAGRILQSTDHSLVPEYNNGSLGWLLRAAATKRGRGEIKQRLVRNRSGEVLGWYIYYLNVGGTSDVLQIGASPATIDRVFACLVEEAERHHSIGLFGRLDPRFMHALWEQKCFFTTPSWVLVHAKDPVLLDSFHTGEALFTGLEGEQWMRFDGDPFQS